MTGRRISILTAAGSDTFSWDTHNQLTCATVNGVTTGYGFDDIGNQVSRTSNGTTTTNLWDDANGIAQLVDDDSTSYVQANGAQEAIASGNTTSYPLTDPTTGFIDPRARALDFTLGRFLC